ncbi:MAG: AraC family ligand binding domain-containing protein, partial [Spirochaeta sp.]|nr:AraC family ligand binding domain-containing protein [Spirochaeta sp.]
MKIRDIVFVYQLKTPELVRWHSRRHHHGPDEFELHYFLGGDGHFRNGPERYVITPGSIHFSAPGELHAIHPGDIRRPVSYYAVLFSPDTDDQVGEVLSNQQYAASFPHRVGTRYRVLFEDLKNRYAHTRPEKRAAATHTLQA